MNPATEPAEIPNQDRFHDAQSCTESLDSTIIFSARNGIYLAQASDMG
jgi:hypothetical protein